MLRVYFYLFISINFLALTCLFIVSFVNVIFIREEYIQIPKIKSSNKDIQQKNKNIKSNSRLSNPKKNVGNPMNCVGNPRNFVRN